MTVLAVVLVFLRVVGLTTTAPVLATPGLEPRFRLLLAAAISAVVAPIVGPAIRLPIHLNEIAIACLGELLIGAALGWSAGLIIAGARQAGEIVGAQAGLSAAALFDPEAGDELTPLGHLYGLIALGVFLSLDGPLMLVRSLVESYEAMPVGDFGLSRESAELAFGRVARSLWLAIRAAAPPAIALTLAGVSLGLIGRAAPALPLATMTLPIRFLLGLVLAILGATALAGTLASVWQAWPSFGS